MLLTFYRWYLLVWRAGFPFTIRDAVRLGYIGYLLGYVAPELPAETCSKRP